MITDRGFSAVLNRLSGWQHTLSERFQNALLLVLAAALALGPRLFDLGVFLTADEAKAWLGRAMMFARALAFQDWRATFDSPAPGVTTMWAGTFGLWIEYLREGGPGGSFVAFLDQMPFDPLDPAILPALRLPGVLISALLVMVIYCWSRSMWGGMGGLLIAVFLALDPFYLALSRILGHDGLMAGFTTASLVALLAALFVPSPPAVVRRPSSVVRRRAIRYLLVISGVLGGLAFLSKYPALFLGAFSAVVLLAVYASRRHVGDWTWRQTIAFWLADVLIWSLAAGLVSLLLWPVLWVDLPATVSAIFSDAFRAAGSSHPKGSFYLGQPVADPGAGFYPLVALFRMTPIAGLGLLLAVVSLFSAGGRREIHRFQPTLILVGYVFLFGLLVTLGGKKQDRYILPALLAAGVLAGLGWAWLVERWRVLRSNAHAGGDVLAAGLLVAAQMAFVLPHHPYYFT
jgi:4-amino-4-deoxy-L-arabinose transferase-like glycosyltransferase